jgi:GTP pyrophosphokinase
MVHTDVGHRTVGARVNGQMVSLEHTLTNGDTVEVMTSKNHVPSKDWLKFVKSSKAKQRIRAFLKAEEHARSLAIGMEILTKDLRKVKLGIKKLEKEGKLAAIASDMGLKTVGELYAGVGYGRISTSKIIAKLLPEEPAVEEKLEAQQSPIQRIFQRAAKGSRERAGVRVSGMDNILIRFAKCCEPLPGDRIVGFITRGRGVTVHYADCSQVLNSDPLRRVEVEWDTVRKAPRRVRITVASQDQMGLLASVTQAITANGANITSAQIKTERGKAAINFEMIIDDAQQLHRIKRAIEMVPGVIKVDRVRHLSPVADESWEDG